MTILICYLICSYIGMFIGLYLFNKYHPDEKDLFKHDLGSYMVLGSLVVFITPLWPILPVFIPVIIVGYIMVKIFEKY